MSKTRKNRTSVLIWGVLVLSTLLTFVWAASLLLGASVLIWSFT